MTSQEVALTVHAAAQTGAPVAADPLHGLLVLLGEGRIATHQVEAGDDHLVHDGDAFFHAGFHAATEQLGGALIQGLGDSGEEVFTPSQRPSRRLLLLTVRHFLLNSVMAVW